MNKGVQREKGKRRRIAIHLVKVRPKMRNKTKVDLELCINLEANSIIYGGLNTNISKIGWNKIAFLEHAFRH